jgi:hypothetical protein
VLLWSFVDDTVSVIILTDCLEYLSYLVKFLSFLNCLEAFPHMNDSI